MANRYWVGGTGDWDGTAGTKWSTSSGGAGGSSVPTGADDVYFDFNSGPGTVTISAGNTGARTLNTTGFTGNITGSATISVGGSLYVGTTTSWNYLGIMTIGQVGVTSYIAASGKLIRDLVINTTSVAAGLQLLNNLTVNNLTLTSGYILTDFNILTINNSFNSNNSNARIINIDNSDVILDGATWDCTTSTGLSVSSANSTIRAIGSGLNNFRGGGKTYNVLSNEGSGQLTITGNNTFTTIQNTVQPATFNFTSGSTQTVTNFNVSGTAGNLVVIKASSSGSQATLSKASGTVTANYLSIKDSNAIGGAVWDALNGTNSDQGNNTGWLLPALYKSGAFMQFF